MKKNILRLLVLLTALTLLASCALADLPPLKSGQYALWFDRVNWGGYETYAKDLYAFLEEAVDNDGTADYLIDPQQSALSIGNGAYAYPVVQYEADISFVLSNDNAVNNERINAAIANLETPDLGGIQDYMQAVYDAFLRDHPEVFWLNGQSLFTTGSSVDSYSGYVDATVTTTYRTSLYFILKDTSFDMRETGYQDAAALKSAISGRDSAASDILSTVPASGRYDQIVAINDWLVTNNAYYNNGVGVESASSYSHSCLSALEKNSGTSGPVCEGYAKAFKVLCDKLGIPCVLVDGFAKDGVSDAGEAHMWNYVQMPDNKWYAMDVTWNDPIGTDHSEEIKSRYRLVGADTVVDGLAFGVSHELENQLYDGRVAFTNGPALSSAAYVKVDPISLTGATAIVDDTYTYTYTGEPVIPSVTVTLPDDTLLTQGTDYTVTSSSIDAGTAFCTITGAGNYTGTIENVSFFISPKLLTIDSVTLNPKTYDGNDSIFERQIGGISVSGVAERDKADMALGKGIDFSHGRYDVTNESAPDSTLAGTGKAATVYFGLDANVAATANYQLVDGTTDNSVVAATGTILPATLSSKSEDTTQTAYVGQTLANVLFNLQDAGSLCYFPADYNSDGVADDEGTAGGTWSFAGSTSAENIVFNAAGDYAYTLTFTPYEPQNFEPFSAEFTINVSENGIADLVFAGFSTHPYYAYGDTVEPSTIMLYATYEDGSEGYIYGDEDGVSFDPPLKLTQPTDNMFTASFGGMSTDSFAIYANPRLLKIASVQVADKTYDGSDYAKVEDIVFDNMVSGDEALLSSCIITADFSTPDAGTDKPVSVSVTLPTGEAADKYTFSDMDTGVNYSSATASADISPAALRLQEAIPPQTGYYPSSALPVAESILQNFAPVYDADTDYDGTADTQVNISGTWSWKPLADGSDPTGVPFGAAGNHTFTAVFTPNDAAANFLSFETDVTFTAAEDVISCLDWSFVDPAKTYVYGDTVNPGDLRFTVTYQSGDDFSFAGDASMFGRPLELTEFGDNAFTATYGGATAQVIIYANSRPITVESFTVEDKTFDGTDDAKVTGVTFGNALANHPLVEGVDYSITASFSDVNAGTNVPVSVTLVLDDFCYAFADPDAPEALMGVISVSAAADILPAAPAPDDPVVGMGVVGQKLESVSLQTSAQDAAIGEWAWQDGSIELNAAGTQTYTAVFTPKTSNYTSVTKSFEVSVLADELEELVLVDGTPDKAAYVYGESFSLAGLRVEARFKSGSVLDVTQAMAYGELSVGQTSVELTYLGKSVVVNGVTVAKAPLTIAAATLAPRAYEPDNKAVAVEGVTFSGLKNGETLTLGTDYTAAAEMADANAGSKTATVTVTLAATAAADNYTLESGSIQAPVAISKIDPTYTLPSSLSGLTGTTLASVALPEGFVWENPNTVLDAEGSFQYPAAFTPKDTTNYNTLTGIGLSVNVVADPVAELLVADEPDVVKYVYGDSFDTYGLVIVAIFESGAVADVTDLASFEPLSVGMTSVTASYGGKSVAIRGVTVAKAPLTVTAADCSITYGDGSVQTSARYDGFVNGEDETVLDASGLNFSTDYAQFGDVGAYKVTPFGLASANYEISYVPGTMTVLPKEITVVYGNGEDRAYGDGKTVTAQLDGVMNSDDVSVTLTGHTETAVGQHTAQAALTGSKAANYALANPTFTYVIGQSGTGISAYADKREYAYGDIITVSVTATATGTPSTFSLRSFASPSAGQIAIFCGETQLTEAKNAVSGQELTFTIDTKAAGLVKGAYTLTAKHVASTEMASASADVNVSVILDLSETTASTAKHLAHTGKPLEPDVTVTLGGTTLVEGVDYTVTYEDNTDVGTAKAIVTGKGSCTGTISVTFEIVQQIETKVEINEGFSAKDIPAELKAAGVGSVSTIETLLRTEVGKQLGSGADTALYDVVLLYSPDGGKTWLKADKEHFPADGRLFVSLPAPEESNPAWSSYTVTHMFTSSAFGKKPGDIETPNVTVRRDADNSYYLDFYVTGLSPIMVGWTDLPDVNLPETGDNSQLPLLIVVVIACGAALVLLSRKKRK